MRLLRNADNPDIEEQTEFANWLLQIGNGTLPGPSPNHGISVSIKLPLQMVMPIGASLDALIAKVYPDLQNNVVNAQYLNQRVILCPTNDDVDRINNLMMSVIPGLTMEIYSSDKILEKKADRDRMNAPFPIECLNALESSSLPPHRLKLTVGCPLILLRNMKDQEDLCNGTRLLCTSISRNLLGATVITGTQAGAHVLLPRMNLTPSDLDVPFKFERTQFPVRPAFAMTINKSQRQTLETVGIYLRKPVFSHGQLYVALSRVTNRNNVHVLIEKSEDEIQDYCTTNVVYPEILA